MMLLAAVLLLIAFLSLSVLVARLGSVPNETQRETEGQFLREVRITEKALGNITALPDAEEPARFAVLARLAAQRGYSLSCTAPDVALLTDGRSLARLAYAGC